MKLKSEKGVVMNLEKFLLTQNGKRPQGPEGGAQKCGQGREEQ